VDIAEIKDATGSARSKDFLSTGTRDAFLLTARLVLAEKSLNKDNRAIIVLDEPFLALDRQRTGRALEILKKFHRDTDLQIVIFTKDEETEKQARAIFGKDLCIHKL
jgi:DNA repair exonuclease SbcCD ATPase subunit